MKTSQKSQKRSQQKNSKQDKNSSGVMRIFYVLMLVLMLSSSIISIAGARSHNQIGATATPQGSPVGGGGTAARIFVYHIEDGGTGACEDLVIPAVGSVVYSNCGTGVERQYGLSDTERKQLNSWTQQFKPINYEHTDPSQTGNITTQLYLNGQGNQDALNTDVQAMLRFADTLAAKIASQP